MKMPAFCKKREFLEAMSQRVSDQENNCYHMLAFRSTTHPSVPPSKDVIRSVCVCVCVCVCVIFQLS